MKTWIIILHDDDLPRDARVKIPYKELMSDRAIKTSMFSFLKGLEKMFYDKVEEMKIGQLPP